MIGVEPSEVSSLVTLLGEYRTRCLLSKTWVLRDAAIAKVREEGSKEGLKRV
jgi:hypothetical protein